MKWLYLFGLYFFQLLVSLAAWFNPKARLWKYGRKHWRAQLADQSWPANSKKVWIHCASLGEFEQGRPIIEKFKSHEPETQIILTFFSPSGYEIRKNYELADLVLYLPLDTPSNSRGFVELLQPDLVIFVKYEFWYFFLRQLHREKIPTFLISALFRPDQVFFNPYGGFFKKMLFFFTHIFVQNEASSQLLEQAGVSHHTIAGDTRVDRVVALADEKKAFPLVQAFAQDHPLLIAGSTWPEDEEVLIPFFHRHLGKNWKVIIAPHEIGATHITAIEAQLKDAYIRYSQLRRDTSFKNIRYLLIDNIGMLASLYQYGTIAYIGGGFGRGIHNTLEPITFGLPVIFGPKYTKFEEAESLVVSGGAFTIQSTEELARTMQWLESEKASYEQASLKARQYIDDNRGATDVIFSYFKNHT